MSREEKKRNIMQRMGKATTDGIRYVDDHVQRLIRNTVLGLPDDGNVLPPGAFMRVPREVLGTAMHSARSGYNLDATQYKANPGMGNAIGVGLSRAAQAGGITAAGVGLANLTHEYQNMFGGPADVSDPELVRAAEAFDYQARVPEERYYGAEGMLPPGNTNGASEGELLVAGLKGFGPFKDMDHYALASRLNDLNEMMEYPPVRGWGERNAQDM